MALALDFRDIACAGNASWATNQTAYIQALTDSELRSWWASVPHINFANQLGASFGGHLTSFACGIGLEETCVLPGCSCKDSCVVDFLISAPHFISPSVSSADILVTFT